jgi:hypothetical protein
MLAISGNDTAVVTQSVPSIVVQVVDTLLNPVEGIVINFTVDSWPTNGDDYLLSAPFDTTDLSGFASVDFTLGSKIGTYQIRAFNPLLSGSPIIFNATALADAADSILVFAGNQQAGIVGDTLALSLQAQVVDQFSNPVAGIAVTWNPTADGDTIVISATSNVNGRVDTQWILRTLAGQDSLIASSAGLPSALFTATAIHDVAATVVAFEGNNRTTIAGGIRNVQAQAQDQYGNPASNTIINFLPVSRVSNVSSVSNSAGIVGTVYTTPQDEDSSLVEAYITGLIDTAAFNIFAFRYISNTLDPSVTAPGDTVDFAAFYSNPGTDTVYFDTTTTIFSFTDGARTANSSLSNPQYLLPGTDSTQLFFNNTPIDVDFVSGNYTPHVDFNGNSGGQLISGRLMMDPGELSMDPIDIISVTITAPLPKRYVQGDTITTVVLSIRNNSLFLIENLAGDLNFAPLLATTVIPDPVNPTTIGGNSTADLSFSVPIPDVSSLGIYSVDGYIEGNFNINGNFVSTTGAGSTDSFEIISGVDVSYVDYSPKQVSENQNTTFTVTVNNTGNANVILDRIQTTLEFGSQIFALDGDQILSGDTTTVLRFAEAAISIASNNYQGTLILDGLENGVPYLDTLYTPPLDSLTVQSRALVLANSIQLSDSVAVKRQCRQPGRNGSNAIVACQ